MSTSSASTKTTTLLFLLQRRRQQVAHFDLGWQGDEYESLLVQDERFIFLQKR